MLILVAAIYAISKSSDLLIDLASSLGRQLHLKDYFIGSLIIGVGTSLPELFTSIAAVGQGAPALVAPTIYGTVVANIGLGLGGAVIALFLVVSRGGKTRLLDTRHPHAGGLLDFSNAFASPSSSLFETPISFAIGSVLLSLALCLDGEFSRLDAAIFLLGYIWFITNEFSQRDRAPSGAEVEPVRGNAMAPVAARARASAPRGKQSDMLSGGRILSISTLTLLFFLIIALLGQPALFARVASQAAFLVGLFLIVAFQATIFLMWRRAGKPAEFESFMGIVLRRHAKILLVLYLAVTIVVVYFSGAVIVRAILFLAERFQIGSTVLAASAIAVGTSLPDVVVAIKVARRGRHRLLIGHIIQSHVFDVFLIMAACGLFVPLPVGDPATLISIITALLVTGGLLYSVRAKKMDLRTGVLLLLSFLIFTVLLYGVP